MLDMLVRDLSKAVSEGAPHVNIIEPILSEISPIQ